MRSCHAQGSCQRPSRQSFYLVTPFWNLKKVLAPAVGATATATATGHGLPPLTRANRQSDCGSATPTANHGCQSSQRACGPGTWGKARKHVIANYRRLGQDLAPLTATTLHSRGQASDQHLTKILTGLSADNGAQTFGPRNDQGSSKPQLCSRAPMAGVSREKRPSCSNLGKDTSLQTDSSPVEPVQPREKWSPRSQPLSYFCFAPMRCGKRIIFVLKAEFGRSTANEDLIFIEAWSNSRSTARLLDPQAPRAHNLLHHDHNQPSEANSNRVSTCSVILASHFLLGASPHSPRVVRWPLGSVFSRHGERAYARLAGIGRWRLA